MKNPFRKQKKADMKNLDNRIIQSLEYRVLAHMNIIMNTYDEIEKLNEGYFSAKDGMDAYIQARFAAHAFMVELLNKITAVQDKINEAELGENSENESTNQDS